MFLFLIESRILWWEAAVIGGNPRPRFLTTSTPKGAEAYLQNRGVEGRHPPSRWGRDFGAFRDFEGPAQIGAAVGYWEFIEFQAMCVQGEDCASDRFQTKVWGGRRPSLDM